MQSVVNSQKQNWAMNELCGEWVPGTILEATGPAGRLLHSPRWEMRAAGFRSARGLAGKCLDELQHWSAKAVPRPWQNTLQVLYQLCRRTEDIILILHSPSSHLVTPHIWGNHRRKGVSCDKEEHRGGGVGGCNAGSGEGRLPPWLPLESDISP